MDQYLLFKGSGKSKNNNDDNEDDDDDDYYRRSRQHEETSSKSNLNNSQTNNQSNNNNRTTDGQTMMHILKANIGTGVLAMPSAFKNVGLWLGFIMVPIIGSICIHCMNILIESHNHLCDRFNYESLDYDQVAALGLACGPKWARRWLAKKAHIIVTIFLIFTQVGFCCVYIMFVIENIQLAMLNLFQVQYSTTTYLMLVFPIIGLTSCTSNLKHLARISTLANILQLAGLGLIFFDLLQFNTYSSRYDLQPINNNNATLMISNFNNGEQDQQEKQDLNKVKSFIKVSSFVSDDILAGLPLFFATAVYAFEGIGVVLPVIKEMQHPQRILGLNGVLNSSMALVAILYMGMGYFGYAKYGQFVQGSITLNLPETTLNELVRLTFAIAIGLSYALQFYVPWTILWPHIDESLFYSYRPRVPRNKLQILSKLSAKNKWDIDEYLYQSTTTTTTTNNLLSNAERNNEQLQDDQNDDQMNSNEYQADQNSNASTFATSYTMSTVGNTHFRHRAISSSYGSISLANPSQQQQQLQQHDGQHLQPPAASAVNAAANVNHNTSVNPNNVAAVNVPAARSLGRRRNRLEDVMEQEEDEDSMPDVEWRPPPKSMRGKRKLVRYTVILVTVSFTFVAAALIPRLDLFISLIGALASSSLAIIFPAIIQTCTFWNYVPTDDQDCDDDDGFQCRSGRRSDHQDNKATKEGGGRQSWKKFKRRVLWHLFVIKNLLLILFGILGLITGSWISITQLSAIYIGANEY